MLTHHWVLCVSCPRCSRATRVPRERAAPTRCRCSADLQDRIVERHIIACHMPQEKPCVVSGALHEYVDGRCSECGLEEPAMMCWRHGCQCPCHQKK